MHNYVHFLVVICEKLSEYLKSLNDYYIHLIINQKPVKIVTFCFGYYVFNSGYKTFVLPEAWKDGYLTL